MNFAGALFDLQRGHKIKRKHWGGYWYFNKNNRIIMHTYDNKEIDLQDSKDIIYTLSNIVADDWEIVKDW